MLKEHSMRGAAFTSFLLCFSILIGGCTSTSVQSVQTLHTVKSEKYKSISISVISDDPAGDEIALQLQSMIVRDIFKKNIFESVFPGKSGWRSPTDLVAIVNISQYRYVHQAARAFFGAMAGPGKLTAGVELINGRTGEPLVRGSAEGVTFFLTFQAVESAAQQIASFIESHS